MKEGKHSRKKEQNVKIWGGKGKYGALVELKESRVIEAPGGLRWWEVGEGKESSRCQITEVLLVMLRRFPEKNTEGRKYRD